MGIYGFVEETLKTTLVCCLKEEAASPFNKTKRLTLKDYKMNAFELNDRSIGLGLTLKARHKQLTQNEDVVAMHFTPSRKMLSKLMFSVIHAHQIGAWNHPKSCEYKIKHVV